MAQGNNNGDAKLFKLRVKINTPDGGLNWVLHLANTTEADALTRAEAIVTRYKAILPSTCEIKHCTISRSNTHKDSRIIKGVLGDGLYGQGGVDPDPTTYNKFDDVLLVRMEDEEGQGITLKIGPVPDTIISNGEVIDPIDSVTDMAPAVAAAGAQPVTYKTEFKNLMHLIGKYCHRVKAATNNPGGLYEYFAFQRAHVVGVSKKKGGRIFVR